MFNYFEFAIFKIFLIQMYICFYSYSHTARDNITHPNINIHRAGVLRTTPLKTHDVIFLHPEVALHL